MKIARVVTVPYAFVHILGVLREIKHEGHELHLIADHGDYEPVLQEKVGARFIPIEIPREISLLKDLIALIRLYRLFKRERYDIVHSSTPKAGLLCAIAANLAGVKVRLHTFTGQRWETLHGPKRRLLIALDKLVGMLNTWNYADSPGQILRLQELGILARERSSCLGQGSYGGIDAIRFEKVAGDREQERQRLGFRSDDFVIAFLGRLCVDKGIPELAEAIETLQRRGFKHVKLLLVGPLDEDLDAQTKLRLAQPHVLLRGFQNRPESELVAADLFCLPSHREGFGTVVLEAAILGLATVGTKIPGLDDAIVDGTTGLLVQKQNPHELAQALERLVKDSAFRTQLGAAAKERARTEFSYGKLARLLLADYKSMLQ